MLFPLSLSLPPHLSKLTQPWQPKLSLPMAPFQTHSPTSLWIASFTFSLWLVYALLLHHRAFPHHQSIIFLHHPPFRPPCSPSVLLTPPSTTASPCRLVEAWFQQSGPHDWSRELAKSTGPGPEQQSWAARAQISPSSEWHWSSPVPWAPAGGEEIRARGRSRLRHWRFQEPFLDCLWNWITDYSQMCS